MSKSSIFLQELKRKTGDELGALYYEHREDFVKWARKKYYSSKETDSDSAAVKAYQRVLTVLKKQSEGKRASEFLRDYAPKSVKGILEAVARDMAISEGLEAGELKMPGLDFGVFEQTAHEFADEAPDGIAGERESKLSEEQISNVKRYLNGELEGDELSRFKVDLAYDQLVAEEVARLEAEQRRTERQAAMKFQDQLADFEARWPFGTKAPKKKESESKRNEADQKQRKEEKPAQKQEGKVAKKKKPGFLVYGTFFGLLAAVVLMVLIGLGSVESKDDPTGLYKANFSALQDYVVVRDEIPRDLEVGMNSYNHGDFAGAVQPLLSYSEAEPRDREARLYLAIAQLANSEESEALRNLQEVADIGKPDALKFHAEWYKGLTYLRAGEKGKAKAIFKKLQFEMAPNADYRAQSRAILEKLKD